MIKVIGPSNVGEALFHLCSLLEVLSTTKSQNIFTLGINQKKKKFYFRTYPQWEAQGILTPYSLGESNID